MSDEATRHQPSAPIGTRSIRVFISSTFRDMQEERDLLIKKVFPQLRKLCEERAVTWSEVDLRWGITDEQKAEGKVLPLCLEEIHRCRPYFIGLLGERYGWVPEPDSIPAELLRSEPWLRQHLQYSVTELEILHGVFSQEPMHGHAYFYFRDRRYLDAVPAHKRGDFAAEDPVARGKLEKLKQRLRSARDEEVCELRENYATPEQLGEWILDDFTRLIDRLYPENQTPDPLDQEAARHDAYARSRRLGFVGREVLIRSLNEHAAAPRPPLVLTGESGCGKSALLAEWAARWNADHPDDLIIQHYIGSTPDSADWQGLVRRILGELKRAFAIKEEIPLQPDALRGALNDWTARVAGSRRVVLVLDGLNHLAEAGAAQQLGWLPAGFPDNFRALISTLPGEALDTLRKRSWPEVNVPLFAPAEIAPAALTYFKLFSKTPPANLVAKLQSTPAACNALFLRAVLDELRQFGKHEDLQATASDYLSARGLPELFDRILCRWDDDFGKDIECPDIVRRSLCLIACARFGLTEAELLELLGKHGEPMPRQPWTQFYLAAENALVLRAGLLTFGHDYLRSAVQRRWLEDAQATARFSGQLAGYFEHIVHPTDRKLDELPRLLSELQEWNRLEDVLTDIPTFARMHEKQRRWELHRYWLSLAQHCRYGLPGLSYLNAIEPWVAALGNEENSMGAPAASHLLHELAYFLFERGEYSIAEAVYRRGVAFGEERLGPSHTGLAENLADLAKLLTATDRLAEAEPLIRRALAIDEEAYGADHSSVAADCALLANLLRASNRLRDAEWFYRRALAVAEKVEGPLDPDVASHLSDLAGLLRYTNRPGEAEPLYRRALEISERCLGPSHPIVAAILNNLAALLRDTGQLVEAEALLRRAIAIDEQNYGTDHPNVVKDLNNLAGMLRITNRHAEAEALYRRALAAAEGKLGQNHPDVAVTLNNLAVLLHTMHRAAEAEPLYRRALEIDELGVGPDHPKVATRLTNLSRLLVATERSPEAEPLMRRALIIFLNNFGPDHPSSQTAIRYYGDSL